jgi:hypothetical protein
MNWFSLFYLSGYDKWGNAQYSVASGGIAQFMNPANDAQYQIAQGHTGPNQNEYQVAVLNKTDVLVEWTGSDGRTHATQVNTGMGYSASSPLTVDLP